MDDIQKKLDEWIASWGTKTTPDLSVEQREFIQDKLGFPGVMISGSKQPRKTKDGRQHLAVFNANLVVEGYGKVWFGDIDVTKDEERLKEIARELKAKVYVLREMDARFSTEYKPKVAEAVYETDGVVGEIKNPWYAVSYERVFGKLLSKVL